MRDCEQEKRPERRRRSKGTCSGARAHNKRLNRRSEAKWALYRLSAAHSLHLSSTAAQQHSGQLGGIIGALGKAKSSLQVSSGHSSPKHCSLHSFRLFPASHSPTCSSQTDNSLPLSGRSTKQRSSQVAKKRSTANNRKGLPLGANNAHWKCTVNTGECRFRRQQTAAKYLPAAP